MGSATYGTCPIDKFVGNPVNVATGNKYEEVIDLALATPGIPLTFKRYYNSRAAADGPLGYGWTHSYNMSLQVVQTSPYTRIRIIDADGRSLYFQPIMQTFADGTHFYGESGVRDKLTQLTSGEYRLRRPDNLDYLFDTNGKLTQIADPNGNTLTLTYTGDLLTQVANNFGAAITIQYSGTRISSVTDPKSQSISYTYANDDLTQAAYSDSRSVSYAYSSHNMTDKYDTASNLIGHWAYDENGKVATYYRYVDNGTPQERIDFAYTTDTTTLTRSTGTATYNTAIVNGIRVVTSIEGCGQTCGGTHKSFTYDTNVNLTGVTYTSSGQNYTANYTYDSPTNWYDRTGEVTEVTEAVGWPEQRTTAYAYTHRTDHPFLLTQETETKPSVLSPGQSKATTTAYDTAGNITSITENGYAYISGTPTQRTLTTAYQYNAAGQLILRNGPRTDVTDTTTYEYYANTPEQGTNRGQLKAIVNALTHRTEFANYDANGNVGTITDPNGVATTFTYDQRNRLLTTTTQSATTQYAYDGRGNLAYIIPPAGNRIDFTYTLADKLAEIKDNLNNRIQYSYDVEGNRIAERILDSADTLTKSLDFTYDAYNRLVTIVNPDTTYTQYSYDDKGNRTAIRDPNANNTSLIYDPLDRLTTIARPLSATIASTYDTHDNPASITDPTSKTTEYQFDDFTHRAWTISPDTGSTSYTYDEAGNIAGQLDAAGGVITSTYDAVNRLTAVQFTDPSQNIAYTYDTGTNGTGRLTGRTDPTGTYTFSYDARGNLSQEQKTTSGILYTTGYSYNTNNVLTSITYPSGRTVTYTRDTAGRISRVDTSFGGIPQTLASSITYMPFGPASGLVYGSSSSSCATYDNQHRLISTVTGTSLDLAYLYDANGNITTILDTSTAPGLTDAAGVYTYQSGTNRLASITGAAPITFGYDANGNITSQNTRTFTYDLLNRPVTVSDDSTPVATYTYNAEGQRIKKVTGSGTTIFHYDRSGRLIAETTDAGSTIAEYVYLNDELLASIRSGTVYYYHNDHLGTPRVLTNSSGTIVWRADYSPFGKAEASIATTENPFRFPGQYYDAETGLHYNYHRYYQPETGRYLTPDPIGLAGGINLYGYGVVRSPCSGSPASMPAASINNKPKGATVSGLSFC